MIALITSARGGPIVTIGAALLFLSMALNGERPAGWSYEGQPAQEIRPRERLMWAALGFVLIGYEVWKVQAWAHSLH